MSYLIVEKAGWDSKELPNGNEECPWCGKDVLISDQVEDGPLEEEEDAECPWCGREFSVMVEYEPTFNAWRGWKHCYERKWAEFADVAVDDDGCILSYFHCFVAGTPRDEVLRYFDREYAKWGGIDALMEVVS